MDWGSVPDWIVAATAVPTALFVGFQLAGRKRAEQDTLIQLSLGRAAQEAQRDELGLSAVARREQVAIARANLLLRIDEQFEGDKLRAARARWLALVERCEAEARARNARWTKTEWANAANHLLSSHFDTLIERCVPDNAGADATKAAATASDEYAELMSLPYWIETLGHLCRRNLLPLEDTLDLYDLVIVRVIGCISPHLQRRRERGPVHSRRFLENASWLFDRAEAWLARDSAVPGEPDAAPTNWKN